MNNAKELRRLGDKLFAQRQGLLTLWQEVCDHFYPERADFTVRRDWSEDFARHLTTSYPVLVRRDLGNAFSAMLRPKGQEWFHMRAAREDREDSQGKAWLEWATGVMRRAMYDRESRFIRATKEGDHDYAALGQCVLSVELNRDATALLYRCWHMRDVVWAENVDGEIDTIHRKWKPTVRDLVRLFGDRVSDKVKELVERDPFQEVECRHIVLPSGEYEGKWRTPFVSLYLECEHEHIIEEVGVYNPIYVIPRWQTVSGSQYAYSPATVAALPDARLIQAMTLTLLEAGEMGVRPPMLATQEAIRSDVQLFPGGITWVDSEYDERLGEVLRPITQDKSGVPFGIEMNDRIQAMIAEAFYINKLTLPPQGGDMTAFEVSQRVQEYIRQALPIFEPMEDEYNGALCEQTFDLLLRAGAFGSVEDIPQSLRGEEIQFRFESPLHQALERQKGSKFLEAKALIAEAVALDPSAAAMLDAQTALRDALSGIGIATDWTRSEEQMEQIALAEAQQRQAQAILQGMEQSAGVAEQLGNAAQALQGA